MAVTLRQLQRWLHMSRRRPEDVLGDPTAELGKFAGWLTGDTELTDACVRQGALYRGCCGCDQCIERGPVVDSVAARAVDALAKKHGANTTLAALMQQPSPAGDKTPANSDSEGGGGGESPESADNSDGESDSAADTPQPAPPPETAEQAARRAAREAATAQKQRLQQLQKHAKAQPASPTASLARRAVQIAKRALKDAKRAASYGQGNGPSLEARKKIAGANGRLRRVSPALRAEMAALINMLVGQGKAAGGQMGPIPVLSPKRLVSRMLVKRPLANALKEDIVTGRPVTLFLPDISPSCAIQAQAACDVANAAGHAGVTGSDVLVFPQSNGMIDEYAAAYVPWFNGKPATTDRAEIRRLFNEVTTGRSRWRVRAVVVIGDHDGSYLYQQIAAMPRIARLIWLHNDEGAPARRGLHLAAAGTQRLSGWPPESLRKVSMVYGCTTQAHMVAGLRLALQDRK